MRNKMIAAFVAAALSQAALAQQGQQAAGAEELEQVVITGTRVANRSALDTAVPVDVVSAAALQNLGVAELNQALSVALPSFNFPRPGLTDGTDTVRPASLRGLAPDQTLVLVNGKRRHTAALVNINGSVGRGSAAVDLNTIPNVAVRAIEVLRDGASAQYGSDAIAGVINLRMREDSSGGELGVSYGWRDSTYETLTGTPPAGATWSAPASISRDRSDGETLTVSGWKGFALGDSGFITVAGEYKDQNRTERGGWDFRAQYARPTSTTFDPREATFDRFSQWYGEPDLEQKTLFVNAGYDVNDNAEFYASASYQDRSAVSAGFQRLANDPSGRNIPSIYPDGFLPQIAPDVTDFSASAGMRWDLAGWDVDASLGYGKNKMQFTIQNTLNRASPPRCRPTSPPAVAPPRLAPRCSPASSRSSSPTRAATRSASMSISRRTSPTACSRPPRSAPRTTRTSAATSRASCRAATTSPTASRCAPPTRRASARRRCSSSSSAGSRPTSSTACPSTSRPSLPRTRSRSRWARSRLMRKTPPTCRSARCSSSTAQA
jgi:iron complex outermembrane receptor protein